MEKTIYGYKKIVSESDGWDYTKEESLSGPFYLTQEAAEKNKPTEWINPFGSIKYEVVEQTLIE